MACVFTGFQPLFHHGPSPASVCVADYRVHVLRHHAEQVGAADLPARLHEEPPGVPPRPPRTSVALLQLHVHARGVRAPPLLRGKDVLGFLNPPILLCSALCSLEQLGFNALLQLMIGVPLEMVHGILRISLLYMAGVLAGEENAYFIPLTALEDLFIYLFLDILMLFLSTYKNNHAAGKRPEKSLSQ